MPAKGVLVWQPDSGVTVDNGELFIKVAQCIESTSGVIGTIWESSFSYAVRPFVRGQPQEQFPDNLVWGLLAEQPNKYYWILRHQHVILKTDLSSQNVFSVSYVFHIQGIQYHIGDFQMRVGKICNEIGAIKGVVLEVEYLLLSSVEQSSKFVKKFLKTWDEVLFQKLPGIFAISCPEHYHLLSDIYSSKHTAVQYCRIMAHLLSEPVMVPVYTWK